MIVHTHVLFIDELNGIESTYIIDKYTTDSPIPWFFGSHIYHDLAIYPFGEQTNHLHHPMSCCMEKWHISKINWKVLKKAPKQIQF